MLQTLKDLLDSFLQPGSHPSPAQRTSALPLAAAVLLVEVVRFDPAADEAEHTAMANALRRRFSLGDDELRQLLELAHTTARSAYDYQRFTGQLNDHFTHDEKVHLVEAMWQVAYADDQIDANENHTISKVAGLLHVTHGEYISAKMRAKEAANVA